MQKIAVVGMSGIFPGALNLEQFSRNIMEKRESIIDIPDDRWIVKPENTLSSEYKPDTACSKRAGVVTGFKFDPDGLLLHRDILIQLDPLQQMVLHAGRDALSQCWSSQEIRKRAGVVLAAIALPTAKSSELAWQIIMENKISCNHKIANNYNSLQPDASKNQMAISSADFITSIDALAAGMVSVPAALLARAMGLMGGSFTLDAACASSLYAIKIACEQLHSGKVDMVVAGGVSRADSLYTQIGFTQLRALSPSGKCSPFDKKADGLVVGEGAGIVVLKRLEDAIGCGDNIRGVITGAGWSNDIEGNLVAPASEGQIRAMRAAYRSAGWSPCDVQYIECHGSATPVGDNIELNSMVSLWKEAGLLSHNAGLFKRDKITGQHDKEDKSQGCAIGSIKSMTGHLLTAAGIAGFIKTLLAMNEKVLPPSLNFSEPATDSPLHTTGFYVQTEPEEWKPMPLQGITGNMKGSANKKTGENRNINKSESVARRAGISAFGFGGINAHILVEEFRKDNYKLPSLFRKEAMREVKDEVKDAVKYGVKDEIKNEVNPIAIVGMEVIIPAAMNLESFRETIFRDNNKPRPSPNGEVENDDSLSLEMGGVGQNGLWIKKLTTHAGEFHIPPNQINDLLPQHLIMLKAAMGAIKDAGISPRPYKQTTRPDFGAAIGIEFDYGATDFHLRWKNKESCNRGILGKEVINSEPFSKEAVNSESDKNISPPLTAERTLGALGGIVASRIAREFKLGGPCFTVSAGASSGMKALDIAIESLRRGETKTFLCGSVDMAGDIREDNLNRTLRRHSSSYYDAAPFDSKSTGIFPSEGSSAIVLKTLEQAQKDGDRIYAVIKGTGTASGGGMAAESAIHELPVQSNMQHCYSSSLSNALNSADIALSDIGLYQAHGSGEPSQDAIEAEAICHTYWQSVQEYKRGIQHDATLPCPHSKKIKRLSSAIGSSASIVGDTHAVSGLLSIIQATLALYHQIIPPIAKFISPSMVHITFWENSGFHFPKFPAFWIKENSGDKRRAVAASMTTDGACSHVVLEEFTIPSGYPAKIEINKERENPLGLNPSQFYEPATTNQSEDHSEMVKRSELIRKTGKIAFLYPGSGNHFPGMGRKIGLMFPDILRDMDETGASLNKRMLPSLYYPKRISWADGWQDDAARRINSHAHNMIFGQVSFGVLMTRVAEKFGLKPDVCIGHSLGETAGLFSLRVWSDPEDMLRRMEASDLFTRKLAGECIAARKVWRLKESETPQWRVAAVNRSKDFVQNVIQSGESITSDHFDKSDNHDKYTQEGKANLPCKSGRFDKLYLLIVNTPDECVIGGSHEQVEAFIRETGCGAMYLDGVVTVHCPVAEACRKEYRDLHRFECNLPQNIDFYSCFTGKKYTPGTEATADSILNQALYGFDYTDLIRNAWDDGVRVFIEMGPGSSCTRAVTKILGDRPHLALSLSSSSKDEDEEISLMKALATLAENGIIPSSSNNNVNLQISDGTTGIVPVDISLPDLEECPLPDSEVSSLSGLADFPLPDLFNDAAQSAKKTADAHVKFLEFSQNNMVELEKQFACLTQIASNIVTNNKLTFFNSYLNTGSEQGVESALFDRDMCMEFATGAAGNVLGESFKVIDTYSVRVRLPDKPLMLVDRIMDIQGEMLSLKSGKIITQHDVKSGAWYLDGGKTPVSISIEAGQADLFLCSWLGIDHVVKGRRRYRLLDAKVTFHRTLPEPGETIEYHIEIDRFLKQGDIYLFFFHYKGFIVSMNKSPNRFLNKSLSESVHTPELLISMRDGCAGFFTPEEVKNSGGIILKKEDAEIITADELNRQIKGGKFYPLVASYQEHYTDAQVENLRLGNMEACFGKQFEGILLGKNLRLPGIRTYQNEKSEVYEKFDNSVKVDPCSRMHLIDRVLDFNPTGGRFGTGFISAEADIHPDDWFLTCHFVDDMVMPGTLMYECCAHALRIFTQRMGWISTRDEPFYDVIPGIESDLKCRGPVTTQTRKARYEIEIKEIGYKYIEPDSVNQYITAMKHQTTEHHYEPYIIADAHMFSDDHRIVFYKNMGMRIVGLSRSEIELFWKQRD